MPSYYTYYVYDRTTSVIYVGYTTNPTYRFDNHESKKAWWGEVETITLFPHDTYEHAVEFEKFSLERYRPKYNVEGVTRPYRAPTRPSERRESIWDDVLSRLEVLEFRQRELENFAERVDWPYNRKQFAKTLFHIERELP